jgi:hypothetical protein
MATWEVDIIVEDNGSSMLIEWETESDDQFEIIDEVMHYISIVPIGRIN